MQVANNSLLAPGSTVDLASPWESEAINLASITSYSIQLRWIGTPEGEYKLQVSNDFNDSGRSREFWQPTIWTDFEGSEQLVNMDGNHTWQVRGAGYMWVRVVWTPTSGSGTLNSARFTIKGV